LPEANEDEKNSIADGHCALIIRQELKNAQHTQKKAPEKSSNSCCPQVVSHGLSVCQEAFQSFCAAKFGLKNHRIDSQQVVRNQGFFRNCPPTINPINPSEPIFAKQSI